MIRVFLLLAHFSYGSYGKLAQHSFATKPFQGDATLAEIASTPQSKDGPLDVLTELLLAQNQFVPTRSLALRTYTPSTGRTRATKPLCDISSLDVKAKPGEKLKDAFGLRDARVQDEFGNSVALGELIPKSSRGDTKGVVVFLRHLG
jgi:hypothetical protein